MANRELTRKKGEHEWEAPSGRGPAARQPPVSFQAAMAQRLRRSLGMRGAPREKVGEGSRTDASSRRVVVKVRVVQVGAEWGRNAAKLHLAYLERDGVERDDGPGGLYGAVGSVDHSAFEQDASGEKHQFRIVLSPEDGQELDLQAYVRTYMQRLERDLGRTLCWAAVNHYNTDNAHAHIVIRGVDAHGDEVRMSRQYVSHGLRDRAEELATEELGPRPERARVRQLEREIQREGHTSLDRSLERRAVAGVVRIASNREGDARLRAALKARLEVLESFGLAERVRRRAWKVSPRLRSELEQMQRRAEGLRAIAAVLRVSPGQCRVVDRAEPREGHRAELERGVQGVIRWKGLDEQGQFCVVVETTRGAAYHLPVSNRVAERSRVGQVLELKRAVDKDGRIEEIARKHGWICDLGAAPEPSQEAFRRRLEQLERMQLAIRDGQDRWRLREDFRAELAKGKQQPYWQLLSLQVDPQPLRDQITYAGYVWLDRVSLGELGSTGFGREVRDALRLRHDHLRSLRLTPEDPKLRWQLRELQQRRLGQALASARGRVAVRAQEGFQGTLELHREANGQRFAEIRAAGRFVLRPVAREDEALNGRPVRLSVRDGRLQLVEIDPKVDRSR